MKNIMVILKHNLKSIMKGWFLLILVLPIGINLFVSVMVNQDGSSNSKEAYYSIGIYSENKDNIIDRLLPEKKFSDRIMINSEKELRKELDDGNISIGVIFNSDNIYKDIKNNKENTIELLYDDKSSEDYVLSILNTGITQISSLGNNKEEFLRLYDEYENEKYIFNYKRSELSEVFAYITMFGLFSMAFLFIAGRGINPLLKEKELKIDRRILVSKISRVEYALGHILGCFVLLLLQSITLVSTFYLLNKNFDISFGWMILLSIALCFVGISIALIVLGISNNSTMYYTLMSIIATPMALLSGGFIPTEFMPETVQKFSLLFPLTWINSAFKKILMNETYLSIGQDLLAAVSISLVLIMLYLVIENNKKRKLN